MIHKLLATAATVFFTTQLMAQDVCHTAFRCTMDYAPVTCTIGDTGIVVGGTNSCRALSQAYRHLCALGLTTDEAPVQCEPKDLFEDKNSCPMLMPPAPDFCEDGTLVVDKDANGCNRPPRCVRETVAS